MRINLFLFSSFLTQWPIMLAIFLTKTILSFASVYFSFLCQLVNSEEARSFRP